MKKNLLLTMAAIMLATLPAFSQFTFTAAPGLNLNSASFGYKFGKAVPFVGIQYAGVTFSTTFSGTRWNYGTNAPENYSNETKVTGRVIMPTLGLKYFVIEKNKVKGYVTAAVSKPFLSAKYTYNGDENEALSDAIDKISLWGGMAGVGAEYFFDDNFSVGGEFGIHCVMGKYSDSYEDTYYNPNTSTDVTANFKDEIKLAIMPTYSKISLNFYF